MKYKEYQRNVSFNKKIVSVEFSGIASIVNDANKLGDKVIRLEVGDVDYDAPIDVKIAVNKAINQKFLHITLLLQGMRN